MARSLYKFPGYVSRKSSTTDAKKCVLQTHVYCDSSPSLMDPAFVVGSGVCGRPEYCKVAWLGITKEFHQ